MSYLDIQNLYKTQDILLFKECYALEKIHGTSSHLLVKHNPVSLHFFSGGEKYENFVNLFNQVDLLEKFNEIFGPAMDQSVVVYGEAYAGKQQGMSATYGTNLKFIVFDVKIGDSWLAVPQAEDIAKKLGLEFVHYSKISTDLKDIDTERDADSVQAIRNGIGIGKMREGVVLRPLIEVIKNNGERIIAKHKRDEFSEHSHPPRVIDPAKIEVLKEAEDIANQWVTEMRLTHILQELPNCTSIEHTAIVIKAMIADIYKEGKGEIVESKETATAIGKVTAQLWKKRVAFLKQGPS